MKRNRPFICSIIIIIPLCFNSVQAEEKFYISKEEIFKRVDTLAIIPTENIIWESLNDEYEKSSGTFSGLKRLISDGIFKPKAYQILKEPLFVDSIASVTDKQVLQKLRESMLFFIVDQNKSRFCITTAKIKMKIIKENNPFTTIKNDFNKMDFIESVFDSLSADAALIFSYQVTMAAINNSLAKWDSYSENYDESGFRKWEGRTYAFSMVATMIGRNCDTLWTGRYGMRILNGKTTGDNIFEEERVKEAVNQIFKKLLKK